MTNMESFSICRSCMNQVTYAERVNYNNRFAEMYTVCTGLQIPEDDTLPKSFCNACRNKINVAYTYRELAHNIHRILQGIAARAYLSQTHMPPIRTHRPHHSCEARSINITKEINAIRNSITQSYPYNGERLERKYTPTRQAGFNYTTGGNANNSDDKTKVKLETATDTKPDVTSSTEVKTEVKEENTDIQIKKEPKAHPLVPSQTQEAGSQTVKTENYETHYCPTCDVEFTSKFLLSEHLKNVHRDGDTTPAKLSCGSCQMTFSSSGDLSQHITCHERKPKHICGVCYRCFKSAAELATHEQVHKSGRPFRCTHCPLKFDQKSALQAHMRMHEKEKPHSCDTCDASFYLATALAEHKRRHVVEKSLTCAECSFCAPDMFTLEQHLLTHRPAKTYKCRDSGEAFNDRTSLRHHTRWHTAQGISCAPVTPANKSKERGAAQRPVVTRYTPRYRTASISNSRDGRTVIPR